MRVVLQALEFDVEGSSCGRAHNVLGPGRMGLAEDLCAEGFPDDQTAEQVAPGPGTVKGRLTASEPRWTRRRTVEAWHSSNQAPEHAKGICVLYSENREEKDRQ